MVILGNLLMTKTYIHPYIIEAQEIKNVGIVVFFTENRNVELYVCKK